MSLENDALEERPNDYLGSIRGDLVEVVRTVGGTKLMTFMCRRYRPKTNRFSLARIFSSHLPVEGKLMGVDGAERGDRDRTLTKVIGLDGS